jgi:hypothetical protein
MASWAGAAQGVAQVARQQQQDEASLEQQLAEREYKRQLILMQQAQNERLQQQMGLDRDRFGLEKQRFEGQQQDAALERNQAQDKRGVQRMVGELIRTQGITPQSRQRIVGMLAETGQTPTIGQILDDPDADLQREIQKAREVGDINKANDLAEIAARGAEERRSIGARGAEDRRTDAAKPRTATDPASGLPTGYETERNARNRQSIAELKQKIGPFTTGMGSLLSNIPATSARNFAAELNTLKANIAFGELAAMRAASKTGGALGAVSERELMLLESALGALDPGQSGANLTNQLDKIDQSIARWQAAQQSGAAPSGGGAPRRGRYNPATGKVEY